MTEGSIAAQEQKHPALVIPEAEFRDQDYHEDTPENCHNLHDLAEALLLIQ